MNIKNIVATNSGTWSWSLCLPSSGLCAFSVSQIIKTGDVPHVGWRSMRIIDAACTPHVFSGYAEVRLSSKGCAHQAHAPTFHADMREGVRWRCSTFIQDAAAAAALTAGRCSPCLQASCHACLAAPAQQGSVPRACCTPLYTPAQQMACGSGK